MTIRRAVAANFAFIGALRLEHTARDDMVGRPESLHPERNYKDLCVFMNRTTNEHSRHEAIECTNQFVVMNKSRMWVAHIIAGQVAAIVTDEPVVERIIAHYEDREEREEIESAVRSERKRAMSRKAQRRLAASRKATKSQSGQSANAS